MSYRPITDTWILARSKVKYYGAFPGGFVQRARDLLGCRPDDVVLHVCSGRVEQYPFKGVGEFDVTMDLDPAMNPDFCLDANLQSSYRYVHGMLATGVELGGVLADPPYTADDAAKYVPGASKLPSPSTIVRHAIDILPIGGRVGVISYEWPRYPKKLARQVALVSVYVGNGNRVRCFAVFERIA